jgi:hypothetical protein
VARENFVLETFSRLLNENECTVSATGARVADSYPILFTSITSIGMSGESRHDELVDPKKGVQWNGFSGQLSAEGSWKQGATGIRLDIYEMYVDPSRRTKPRRRAQDLPPAPVHLHGSYSLVTNSQVHIELRSDKSGITYTVTCKLRAAVGTDQIAAVAKNKQLLGRMQRFYDFVSSRHCVVVIGGETVPLLPDYVGMNGIVVGWNVIQDAKIGDAVVHYGAHSIGHISPADGRALNSFRQEFQVELDTSSNELQFRIWDRGQPAQTTVALNANPVGAIDVKLASPIAAQRDCRLTCSTPTLQ